MTLRTDRPLAPHERSLLRFSLAVLLIGCAALAVAVYQMGVDAAHAWTQYREAQLRAAAPNAFDAWVDNTQWLLSCPTNLIVGETNILFYSNTFIGTNICVLDNTWNLQDHHENQ